MEAEGVGAGVGSPDADVAPGAGAEGVTVASAPGAGAMAAGRSQVSVLVTEGRRLDNGIPPLTITDFIQIGKDSACKVDTAWTLGSAVVNAIFELRRLADTSHLICRARSRPRARLGFDIVVTSKLGQVSFPNLT